jgi:L-aspartate oxidase
MIGGVAVDSDGHTSLAGLWAAGEVAASGLHGANRLASNSLLEGIVYGARVGEAAAGSAAATPPQLNARRLSFLPAPSSGEPLDTVDIRNSLQSLMWRSVGVVRNANGLQSARQSIEQWCRYVLEREVDSVYGWETQNLLTVARLVVEAALRRTETRGVHMRSDFPHTDDAHWLEHTEFVRG